MVLSQQPENDVSSQPPEKSILPPIALVVGRPGRSKRTFVNSMFSMRTSNGIFWIKKHKKMHFLAHVGPKTAIFGQKYSI